MLWDNCFTFKCQSLTKQTINWLKNCCENVCFIPLPVLWSLMLLHIVSPLRDVPCGCLGHRITRFCAHGYLTELQKKHCRRILGHRITQFCAHGCLTEQQKKHCTWMCWTKVTCCTSWNGALGRWVWKLTEGRNSSKWCMVLVATLMDTCKVHLFGSAQTEALFSDQQCGNSSLRYTTTVTELTILITVFRGFDQVLHLQYW